ncbi:Hypothetical protein RG1141_CH01340 [Neorhizobium galegae bv. officinalis bv. officinalis str. HAMBI 1141]|uniref:Uncharacterized protein n=1 Tax=Neorhizobium galegae bv. officinalis bv. officinalis str. HAMBI 1141 TaxID=1028801 RepID=A0A068T331_NEOGA|nr:Hypothetical protein RG1141_CH01340 [Neorhizobium galegae bv. officinalis bv. officinalis str. HAMBI 1141]
MNRAESIRHNIPLILQQVRGKRRHERQMIYAVMRLGPLGPPLVIVGLVGLVALAALAAERETSK